MISSWKAGHKLALVIDASAAVAWFLPDEFDGDAVRLLDFVVAHEAIVPALWVVEMQNALRNAHRRARITAAEAERILAHIARLPIRVVDCTDRPEFHGAFAIAVAQDLSVYDAVYLDVAKRHSARLATRDQRVRAAAEALGIATGLDTP